MLQVRTQVADALRFLPDPVGEAVLEGSGQMRTACAQQGQHVAAAQKINANTAQLFVSFPLCRWVV